MSYLQIFIERTVFDDTELRPQVYCRYIDDIFIVVKDMQHLEKLQNTFQEKSCLRFTIELNNNNTLPFLDVLVSASEGSFSTTVYTKKTNVGMCLNADSEAPLRYRISVINSYVNRAFTHCSSWAKLHSEIKHVTQVLVNIVYANKDIQETLMKKMKNFMP